MQRNEPQPRMFEADDGRVDDVVAAGAPAVLPLSREVADALAPLRTLQGARAHLARAARVTVGIDGADGAYTDVDLPPPLALELFDALPGGGPLLFADVELPAVLDAARALAARYDLAPLEGVRARLIVSRGGRSTLAHFDDPTGINVQLVGRKRWRVAGGRAAPPPRGIELAFEGLPEDGVSGEAEAALDREIVMEEGSALFLPAGAYHQVDGETDSVSLIVSFHNLETRWVDALVGAVQKLLLSDATARLPWTEELSRSSTRRRQVGRRSLDRLREAVARLEPEHLLAASGGTARARPDGAVRFNPLATIRPDPSGAGKTALTVGVAGFYGESGRLTLPDARAARVLAAVEAGGAHLDPGIVRALGALGALDARGEGS